VHNALTTSALEALKTLDAHLTRTFLVGERITLADIVVATYVQRAATITIDALLRAQLPNLIRHLETVINQPQPKDIFQPTRYIDRALQSVPPKKEKEKLEPPPVPSKSLSRTKKTRPQYRHSLSSITLLMISRSHPSILRTGSGHIQHEYAWSRWCFGVVLRAVCRLWSYPAVYQH
jgi:Glutathione S-transferase, C-terminal domain